MPVMGMMPMHMPTFCRSWNDHIVAHPTSTSFPNGDSILIARKMVENMSAANSISSTTDPTKPNSSARSAKTKSVCASGRKPPPACVALPMPLPNIPPEPTAIFACWRL